MEDRGGKKTHHYPTRGKCVPNIQKHASEIFSKSFICRSIREFSKMPDSIKSSKNYRTYCDEEQSTLNLMVH